MHCDGRRGHVGNVFLAVVSDDELEFHAEGWLKRSLHLIWLSAAVVCLKISEVYKKSELTTPMEKKIHDWWQGEPTLYTLAFHCIEAFLGYKERKKISWEIKTEDDNQLSRQILRENKETCKQLLNNETNA